MLFTRVLADSSSTSVHNYPTRTGNNPILADNTPTDQPPPALFGFINKAGHMVIPPQFNYTSDFENGMAIGTVLDEAGKPKKLITIDKHGRRVLEQDPSVRLGGLFKDGLSPFIEGGRYGYIDRQGVVRIPPQFKSAKDFEDGYAEVCDDNYATKIIDKSGNAVIEPSKRNKKENTGLYTSKASQSANDFEFINLPNATFCLGPRTGLARFHDGVACVHDNQECGYVDKTGAFILPMQNCIGTDFSEGLAYVNFPQGRAFIDVHGKKVFSLTSEQIDAGPFHEGRAPILVRSQGSDAQGQPLSKIGFVDRLGRMVIPPKILPERINSLDGVSFSDGLCKVFDGTKYGFIDKTGKLAIPYKFHYVCDFHEGLAAAVPDQAAKAQSLSTHTKLSNSSIQPFPDTNSKLMDERVKLMGSYNGEPYIKPASERLRILQRVVEIDDSLHDNSKTLSEDLSNLANTYEELNELDKAEATWKRYVSAKDGFVIEPLKNLLTRAKKFKELEEFLKTRISELEKVDIIAESEKQPENLSKEDLAVQSSEYIARQRNFIKEMLEARVIEPIVYLGDLYYATRQYPLAQVQYERAYKFVEHKWPTAFRDFDVAARWRLALFYARQGNTKLARDKFHELLWTAAAAGQVDRLQNNLFDSFLALLHQKNPDDFEREKNSVPRYAPNLPTATWGFIDETGKQIITPRYTDAGAFKNGLANVAELGGWGYIDSAGDWKIGPHFYVAKPFSEGVAVASQSVDEVLPLPNRYQESPAMKSTGLTQNLSYGFIDPSGKYVVEPRYHEAEPLSQAVSPVQFSQGQLVANYGYVTGKGTIALPPTAYTAEPLKNGIAQFRLRHKAGNVTINGSVKAIERDYDIRLPASAFSEWLSFYNNYLLKQKLVSHPAHVATTDFLNPCPAENSFDAPFGFVDMHGEVFIKPQYEHARPFTEGLAAIQIKDKWGFINTGNKLVIPAAYDDAMCFDSGVARVQKGELWGLVNHSGKIILPCQYKSISDFSEDLAVVTTGEPQLTSGFVDSHGKIVIATTYGAARPFKNNFAAVKIGNRWGFINKKGELVIPAQYHNVRDFSDGKAAVDTQPEQGY